MRKLLYTLFIILLPSCDAMLPHTVTSDGKEIVGEVGSIYWEMAAPQRDITAYYSSKSVIDLCLMWEDLEDDDSYRNYQGIIKKRKNNVKSEKNELGHDYRVVARKPPPYNSSLFLLSSASLRLKRGLAVF